MPYDGNQSGGAPRPKHEVHSKFLHVLAKSPPPVPPLDSLTKTSTPVSSHPLAQCSVDPAMLNSRSALLYRLRRCNTSTTVALESVLFRPPSIPPRHRSLDHQRCIGKHTVSLDGLTSVGSAFASLRFPVEAHWKFACRIGIWPGLAWTWASLPPPLRVPADGPCKTSGMKREGLIAEPDS